MLQLPILVTFMAILVAICASADDMYRCEDGVFTCTKQAAYICATNGVSYLNHCEFFNAYCSNKDINFKHDGKCDEKSAKAKDAPATATANAATNKPVTGTANPNSGYSPAPAPVQQAAGSTTYSTTSSTPAPAKSSALSTSAINAALLAAAFVLISV